MELRAPRVGGEGWGREEQVWSGGGLLMASDPLADLKWSLHLGEGVAEGGKPVVDWHLRNRAQGRCWTFSNAEESPLDRVSVAPRLRNSTLTGPERFRAVMSQDG